MKFIYTLGFYDEKTYNKTDKVLPDRRQHLKRIEFLDFIHNLIFLKKHNVSESGSVSELR
jgi:hypothetical protein